MGLHSRGCPWGIDTCSCAADGGHLEVLRYAHEHGCPWTSYTCDRAAEGGHLEVLRYAHEHGCEWNYLASPMYDPCAARATSRYIYYKYNYTFFFFFYIYCGRTFG
jgi:hypothetical protein